MSDVASTFDGRSGRAASAASRWTLQLADWLDAALCTHRVRLSGWRTSGLCVDSVRARERASDRGTEIETHRDRERVQVGGQGRDGAGAAQGDAGRCQAHRLPENSPAPRLAGQDDSGDPAPAAGRVASSLLSLRVPLGTCAPVQMRATVKALGFGPKGLVNSEVRPHEKRRPAGSCG